MLRIIALSALLLTSACITDGVQTLPRSGGSGMIWGDQTVSRPVPQRPVTRASRQNRETACYSVKTGRALTYEQCIEEQYRAEAARRREIEREVERAQRSAERAEQMEQNRINRDLEMSAREACQDAGLPRSLCRPGVTIGSSVLLPRR